MELNTEKLNVSERLNVSRKLMKRTERQCEMDNDPRWVAFDELWRTSMDISNRQTRQFNESEEKGCQRSYSLQLGGRLLRREVMILG